MSQEPTEEEVRAYVEQLREADAADLVVQAYTMLGTGAEVKLGRPDARVLIDAMAGVVQAAGRSLPEQLVSQLATGVGQLQSAQVQAEQHVAAGDGAQDGAGAPGAPAAAGPAVQPTPAAPDGGAERPRTEPAPPAPNPADRLWIPGRDRGPGR